MPKTLILALIPEDQPVLYTVTHRPAVDPVQAIRAAAAQFLATPGGQATYLSHVYPDAFNWGDADLLIPWSILRRHGVTRIERYEAGALVVVAHDEPLAALDETAARLLAADRRELVAELPGPAEGPARMSSELRPWQAVDGQGHNIITVLAANGDAARERVRDQLDRPGRYGILQQWQAGGERVQPVAAETDGAV
jgi:hypothetical protein